MKSKKNIQKRPRSIWYFTDKDLKRFLGSEYNKEFKTWFSAIFLRHIASRSDRIWNDLEELRIMRLKRKWRREEEKMALQPKPKRDLQVKFKKPNGVELESLLHSL